MFNNEISNLIGRSLLSHINLRARCSKLTSSSCIYMNTYHPLVIFHCYTPLFSLRVQIDKSFPYIMPLPSSLVCNKGNPSLFTT